MIITECQHDSVNIIYLKLLITYIGWVISVSVDYNYSPKLQLSLVEFVFSSLVCLYLTLTFTIFILRTANFFTQ